MAAKSLREAGLCIIQQAVPDDVILAAGTQANAVAAEVMAALSGAQQRRFLLPLLSFSPSACPCTVEDGRLLAFF